MSTGSEKDEPCEIQTFSNIKIKQVFASGNSSFAITDGGNNLYGWGDNENGQLGLNFERSKKVQVPKIVDLGEKISNEIVVLQNKQAYKSYIAHLYRPASNVSQAMIYFINKNLYYKEIELKAENEKLQLQEEQIKKRKNILDDNVTVNF
jgi:alpha-tubulin suppressor-like RCC1 family protein